jgi:hypothetical protein
MSVSLLTQVVVCLSGALSELVLLLTAQNAMARVRIDITLGLLLLTSRSARYC